MVEIKTGIFAKNVQKRLNRAQEKVRGAADEAEGEDDDDDDDEAEGEAEGEDDDGGGDGGGQMEE